MPNYCFNCTTCGEEYWKVLSIADRDSPQSCVTCKRPAERLFTAPRVAVASLPDGAYRKGWKEARELYQLEHKMRNTRDKTEEKYIKKHVNSFTKT
jgi:putative FmdB family regulatory protein